MANFLKYGLFIWLTVVIFLALWIPQKGNLNQSKKFSEVLVNSKENSYKIIKNIPVIFNNKRLHKINDTNNINVLLNYELDSSTYDIRIIGQNKFYGIDKSTYVDIAYDSTTNKYLGIISNSLKEFKSKRYSEKQNLKDKEILQVSNLIKLDSANTTLIRDTLDSVVCNYIEDSDSTLLVLKKAQYKELKNYNALVVSGSFNENLNSYSIDTVIGALDNQIDDNRLFSELKQFAKATYKDSQKFWIFEKYKRQLIYSYRLNVKYDLDQTFNIVYKPGDNFVIMSSENYQKIINSTNFIIETAFDDFNGIYYTGSIVALNPNYSFDYLPALADKSRILFFHVPTAWVSTIAFIMSLIYGILYLKKKDVLYDYKAASCASLGLLFSLLATVTGAVWAKFNWGVFWNWDPRQISIFVLILIYGAYFALRSAIDSDESRAKLSSIYAILAGITVPFFIFILPRVVESLHPDPIVNTDGKIYMNGVMLIVFLSSLAGFTGLFAWMLNLRIRIAKLKLKESN